METVLQNLGRFAHFLLHILGLPFVPYLNLGYYVDRLYRRALEKNHLTFRAGEVRHIDSLFNRYVLNGARARRAHRRGELFQGKEKGTLGRTDSPAKAGADSMAQSKKASGKVDREERSIDDSRESEQGEQESPIIPSEDQGAKLHGGNAIKEAGNDSIDALLLDQLGTLALGPVEHRDLCRIAEICGQLINRNLRPYNWLANRDPNYYNQRIILRCLRLEAWRLVMYHLKVLRAELENNASSEIIERSKGDQSDHAKGELAVEGAWQQEKMEQRIRAMDQFTASCGISIRPYADKYGLTGWGLCMQTRDAWTYLIDTLKRFQGWFEAGLADLLSYEAFAVAKIGISIYAFLKLERQHLYLTETPDCCYLGNKPMHPLEMIEETAQESDDEEDMDNGEAEKSGSAPAIQ